VTIAYHLSEAEKIIAGIRAHPELARTKILVGGYPFKLDATLWRSLGADGTAGTAREAIKRAEALLEEEQ
jgi:methanogenic corrinoid protein MtbC1